MTEEPADLLRPTLLSIAYRITGSRADAEDIVQETALRWLKADRSEVRSPRAFLTTIVTRLSLNHLRDRQARREDYPGDWLPEPVDAGSSPPDEGLDAISFGLLTLLECLTPLQRAVFVLRSAFECDYSEISAVVGRDEAACRKIYSRAREAVDAGRPKRQVPPSVHNTLLARFLAAAESGDVSGLARLPCGGCRHPWRRRARSAGAQETASRKIRGCEVRCRISSAAACRRGAIDRIAQWLAGRRFPSRWPCRIGDPDRVLGQRYDRTGFCDSQSCEIEANPAKLNARLPSETRQVHGRTETAHAGPGRPRAPRTPKAPHIPHGRRWPRSCVPLRASERASIHCSRSIARLSAVTAKKKMISAKSLTPSPHILSAASPIWDCRS